MTKISNLYTLTNYISANSSGNVVIAAPSSGYALELAGNGYISKAYSNTSDMQLVLNGNIAGINIRSTQGGRFSILEAYVAPDTTSFYTSTGTNNPSIEVIRIANGSGDVTFFSSISTIYASLLQVGSATAITNNARFTNATTSTANGSGVGFDFALINSAGSGKQTGQIASVWSDNGANSAADLVFYTRTSGAGISEKMRLSAEGNLLLASGSTAYVSSGAFYLRAGTSGDLILGAGGTNGYMRISDVGSVSIGMTSSPYGRVAIKSNNTLPYMGLNVYATGNANFTYMNHNNNVGIIGTEFGTGGTGHTPLTFQVGGSERLRIDTNGDIVFGITPSYDTTLYWRGSFTGTSYAKIWADGNPRFNVQVNGTGGVYVAAGGTSWTAASDERLKTDLIPIENGLDKISQLRSVTGRYTTDEESKSRSFLIAQDVLSVLPEAVDIDAKTGMMGVQYTEVIPLLVASIKELSAKVTALENK